jgi:small subunit ribosomal protein S16
MDVLLQVGILEPKYRVGAIKQQVIKADSAAKSLIQPKTTTDSPKKVSS